MCIIYGKDTLNFAAGIYNVFLVEVSNKQIMPEVVILGFINDHPAYRDLMRAECKKHIPIF